METSDNLTLLDRLLAGEEPLCPFCKKGHMKRCNPNYPARENHGFVCDHCGEHIHWDPVVEIN
jgi:hypothetical protein